MYGDVLSDLLAVLIFFSQSCAFVLRDVIDFVWASVFSFLKTVRRASFYLTGLRRECKYYDGFSRRRRRLDETNGKCGNNVI